MINELKVGDKVCGNFCGKYSYVIVTDLTKVTRKTICFDGSVNESYTDLKVSSPDGVWTYSTKKENCFLADERTLEINRKSLYQVNEILGYDNDNKVKKSGYFGVYSKINYKGKETIVFVKSGECYVEVVCPFFDKIFYNNDWSGDYRWNGDKPIVVYDKKLGYNMLEKHSHRLLCNEWLRELSHDWKGSGKNKYLDGLTSDGRNVIVSEDGNITEKMDCEKVMNEVKRYGKEDILKWIENGKPCGYIRGLEYKGARMGYVSIDKAKKLFETHNVFVGRFNSAEWQKINCQVVLVFRDYADSDYD